MTRLYAHMFSIAFSIETCDPTGLHIPADLIRLAVKRRVDTCDDAELLEAVGLPDDTGIVTTGEGQP